MIGFCFLSQSILYKSGYYFYDLTLTFRHIDTEQEFSVYGGHALSQEKMELDDNLAYPDIKNGDVIKAPYGVPFFFADLDFDGKNELITGLWPCVGQREVGNFSSIYKIKNGKAINATEYFTDKSEIFESIDQFYFFVNNAHKEIILYSDGGAINFGWKIYKFNNGEYLYDRHIRCDYNTGSSSYIVTVLSPQGEPIKSFTVGEDQFNRDQWNY